jgi:ActR/RegA family two-component response regulator
VGDCTAGDGLETPKRLLAPAPDTRVVMVTAFASVELAVDAMRLGEREFDRSGCLARRF